MITTTELCLTGVQLLVIGWVIAIVAGFIGCAIGVVIGSQPDDL